MKRLRRITKIILIFIILIFTLQLNIFAKPEDDSTGEKIWGTFTQGFGYWIQDDTDMDINITIGHSGAESSSKEFTERIVGMLQAIGSVISVIALMIIGFRYMFSSLEEKAQMKGVLIYYIIGAVMVFATSQLLGVVYDVMMDIT